MSKKEYAAWSKIYEPVWLSGSWLGEDAWNAGLDRMTALGIGPLHVWSIMVSGQDLVLTKGLQDEWSGVLVTLNPWKHSYLEGEQTWNNFLIGTSQTCSKCDGHCVSPSGLPCKPCKGYGFIFDLSDEFSALDSKISALEKHFVGDARYREEIKLGKDWEKKYKPIFYTFDDGIDDALEKLSELGVSEDHLWTGYYEFAFGESAVKLTLSTYDEDVESAGSKMLYVTKNPFEGGYFEYLTLETGYSCMECGGEDLDCEACSGEEPYRAYFGPHGLSSDLEILEKHFG
jgi:hypothetical protein